MDHIMCHGDKRKLFPDVTLSLALSLGLVMVSISGAGAWGPITSAYSIAFSRLPLRSGDSEETEVTPPASAWGRANVQSERVATLAGLEARRK